MTKRTSTKSTRQKVFERDRGLCRYCGKGTATTLDHVIPRTQGGKDTAANLVACCGPCNIRKGGRTPEQAGMVLLRPGTLILVPGAGAFGEA